jgi:hypothetical protein
MDDRGLRKLAVGCARIARRSSKMAGPAATFITGDS